MGKWILIITVESIGLNARSVHTASVEFDDERSCRAAAETYVNARPQTECYRLVVVGVQKGSD